MVALADLQEERQQVADRYAEASERWLEEFALLNGSVPSKTDSETTALRMELQKLDRDIATARRRQRKDTPA